MNREHIAASILSTSILVPLLAGCATDATSVAPEAGGDAEDTESSARELRDAERKLRVARARLEVARLEATAYETEQGVRARHASAEVELAKASLARFQEADSPNRLASEKLELRSAKDRAQEAADELAQIEIMYEDQDLDDRTAEFVVSRGRRAAERAAARIAIQEGELAALETLELPEEEARLKLALEKAIAEAEALARETEIGTHEKTIAVQEAENELARLEEELAELLEGADE